MYQPNPIIVARAVELWKRALAAPKYQHERPEFATLTTDMQSMMVASLPKNNTPATLEKFGTALHELLMKPSADGGHVDYLHVDYHPDATLQAAAEAAGLRMHFPWKSQMYLTGDRVGISIGAATPMVYHHPLSDGRWVVTDLRGVDMADILARIEAGQDMGIPIES